MLEAVVQRILRAVFGGGADISAANPLPVDTSPGNKVATVVVNVASIALGARTTLANSAILSLKGGQATLALTVKARYDVAATRGIKVHVVTSPDNIALGSHPGAINLTVMTDPTAHFIADELIGLVIVNITDGSTGIITDNDETTVTTGAGLAGGATNRWNPGNTYSITGANYDTEDWDAWTPAFLINTVLRQTKSYDTSPIYVKVLVENLDPAVAVADVLVTASVGV